MTNTIHLIAPSGAMSDPKLIEQGVAWCASRQIKVNNTACGLRRFQRFAGTDQERLDDINAIAEINPQTIVMSLRGGYGLHRLLTQINWSAIASRVNAGMSIVGHSDFTAFSLGLLAKTGAPSFAGPMFSSDLCNGVSDFTWKHFVDTVMNRRLDIRVAQAQLLDKPIGLDLSDKAILWGGNLTMLVGLLGTDYLPSHEQIDGGILFIEDVHEHPYRIERMLHQLIDAGYLSRQRAILVGSINAYKLNDDIDRSYNLDTALQTVRNRLPASIPVLTGLPFGHITDKVTLPVGLPVNLQASQDGFLLSSQW